MPQVHYGYTCVFPSYGAWLSELLIGELQFLCLHVPQSQKTVLTYVCDTLAQLTHVVQKTLECLKCNWKDSKIQTRDLSSIVWWTNHFMVACDTSVISGKSSIMHFYHAYLVIIITSRLCGRGNVFIVSVCVCVCLCPSVWAITFEAVDIETSFLVWWYILTISRSSKSIKVIGLRSRLSHWKC